MFTKLLLDQPDIGANGRQKGQFIVDGVKRMSALFEGLHAFAVSGFEDLAKPLDLHRIVADVLANLGHAIKTSNATFIVDPLPMALGNEQHLTRVFQNLIANAINYRSQAPVKIRITAEQLGAEWIVKIQDNGVGIAAEYREQVFGLFKRLHGPENPGAGIGLAICKKIVEAMGGTIWVESEVGFGSTFCFTVPAAHEEMGMSGRLRTGDTVPAATDGGPAERGQSHGAAMGKACGGA